MSEVPMRGLGFRPPSLSRARALTSGGTPGSIAKSVGCAQRCAGNSDGIQGSSAVWRLKSHKDSSAVRTCLPGKHGPSASRCQANSAHVRQPRPQLGQRRVVSLVTIHMTPGKHLVRIPGRMPGACMLHTLVPVFPCHVHPLSRSHVVKHRSSPLHRSSQAEGVGQRRSRGLWGGQGQPGVV